MEISSHQTKPGNNKTKANWHKTHFKKVIPHAYCGKSHFACPQNLYHHLLPWVSPAHWQVPMARVQIYPESKLWSCPTTVSCAAYFFPLRPHTMLYADGSQRGGPCKTWIISFCSIKALQSLLTPYSKIQIPVTSPSYLPEYPSHRSSPYPRPYSLCILLRDPSKHVPTTGPSHHLSSVSWTSHFLYSSITSFSSLLKCHCIRVHS